MNQRRLDLKHGSSNTIAPPAPFDLKNPEDWPHASINHKQSEAKRVGKKAAGNSSTWSFTSFTRN